MNVGTGRVDPSLVDVRLPFESGYSDRLKAMDTTDALVHCCGSASRAFPSSMWLERKDWRGKAKQNDEDKSWGYNRLDRFTNQNPTHECTCHSLRANVEAARNKQRGIIFNDGPKKDFRYDDSKRGSVWLSPLSVYAEANPRQWGGANVQHVLEIAARRGMLPEKIQPNDDYKFKHDLVGTTGNGGKNQSHGSWVSLEDFPDGWEETAKLFRPEEIVFPETWEQAVCLVLAGYIVSVGRAGHAVPWSFWNDEEQVMGYVDSYDVVRYDSLRTVQGCGGDGSFSVISVTAPDDWMRPAGAVVA